MIIICGMHRSGTSMTARILNDLGLDFGDEELLLKGDKWNEKGYYENCEILDVNNQMLLGRTATAKNWIAAHEPGNIKANLAWTIPKLRYFLFPGPAFAARRSPRFQDRMKTLCQKYQGVAVKDVRYSITLKEWLPYGVMERMLYCFRHPYEVARSVTKREGIPVWLCYKIWAHHVRSFLEVAQRQPVTMVYFGNFFLKDRRMSEMERLFRFAGLPMDEAKAADLIGDVVEKRLRHWTGNGRSLPKEVDLLFNRLVELHSRHADLEALD